MAKTTDDVIPALNFTMPGAGDRIHDPNSYFTERFPEAVEKYGAAFMVGSWTDPFQQTHILPVHLNTDFFAGVLGGSSRLGHKVVYFQPEGCFFFFDPMVDAFVPTTGAKFELLLSNLLVKCAQACGRLVDVRPLVETFRKPAILQSVIERARAMLQADAGFFQGNDGHRRFVDGRYIEANEEPSYRQFVHKALVARPEGKVTLPDAFHRYYQFCTDNHLRPLTRADFKHLVSEVIREEFNIGLRHDVPGRSGKQNHGWLGIDCRLDAGECHGRN